ncbi:MAG: DNA-processing protein DprA [Thermoanaerobaculia bacterium]
MAYFTATPEELLGSLNAVERRNSPKLLWYQGHREFLRERRVSVVGTRKASEAGLRRAARLATELARADVVVVSGLALGVDAAAHRAAIQAGGRTIAVLGNGIDLCSPKANQELQELIARDHLVLSQFEPGTLPIDRNFPQRNRTMALVSEATVIIEAQERSGTVTQGWEGIRLGRPVFVLRSLLESGLAWPKLMVDYGAEVLDGTYTVLDALPPVGRFDAVAMGF